LSHRIFIILQKGTFSISTFALLRCGAHALIRFQIETQISESLIVFIFLVIQKSKTAKLDMDITPVLNS